VQILARQFFLSAGPFGGLEGLPADFFYSPDFFADLSAFFFIRRLCGGLAGHVLFLFLLTAES